MIQHISSSVQDLRRQSGSKAKSSRNIALLSTIGLLDFIPIVLYQLGAIRHLPDLPGKRFDSDFVNASNEAEVAGIPDGPVSLLMYAGNLLLVTCSLKWKKNKIFQYLIAGNTVGQAAGGAYYLYIMLVKQKKICPYCIAGALINFATLVPLTKLLSHPNKD